MSLYSGKISSSSYWTLSGMNLPPSQCYPSKFYEHFFGIPKDIKYFGTNIL